MTERIYPRWIHHPEKGSVIVQNAEHEGFMGEGWYDSPGYFPGAEYEIKPTEPAKNKGGRPRAQR